MNNSLSYETQLTVRLVNGMNKLLSLLQSRSIGDIHSESHEMEHRHSNRNSASTTL